MYRALEESYKDIIKSDSQEYKVCADVSASVSRPDFHKSSIFAEVISLLQIQCYVTYFFELMALVLMALAPTRVSLAQW